MFFPCLSPWRGWRPLEEGGVRLSLSVLRACSYKTKAEAWHQGFAPSSSRGGCRFLLFVMTQIFFYNPRNTKFLIINEYRLKFLEDNTDKRNNNFSVATVIRLSQVYVLSSKTMTLLAVWFYSLYAIKFNISWFLLCIRNKIRTFVAKTTEMEVITRTYYAEKIDTFL